MIARSRSQLISDMSRQDNYRMSESEYRGAWELPAICRLQSGNIIIQICKTKMSKSSAI